MNIVIDLTHHNITIVFVIGLFFILPVKSGQRFTEIPGSRPYWTLGDGLTSVWQLSIFWTYLVVQKFYRCRESCLPVTQKLRFICRMSTRKEEENFIIDILQQNHQLFRNYINKKKETNYKEIQKSETTETGCIFWQCI